MAREQGSLHYPKIEITENHGLYNIRQLFLFCFAFVEHSYRVVVAESKPEVSATEVCYEPVAKRQRLETTGDGDNLKVRLDCIQCRLPLAH